MSTIKLLESLLSDNTVKSIIEKCDELYWTTPLAERDKLNEEELRVVNRIILLLVSCSFQSEQENDKYAETAYRLLKSISIQDLNAQTVFDNILGYNLQDKYLLYYFYQSSLALKLDKVISTRILLSNYPEVWPIEDDWSKRVLSSILRSLLFLVRKQNGFGDIRKAIAEIELLRKEQKVYEEKYIDELPLESQANKAFELLALYHVSKALTDVADYLADGYRSAQRNINASVRQHIDIALSLIQKESRLHDFINLIWADLQLLIRNSIWTQTSFHDKIKKLCKFKSEKGILELLPSQQSAIKGSLLDVAANAVILQMPTSAGKTLMAEFNILVTKSLRSDARIVYVVPSRALMNQVFFDLRSDLDELGYKIEKTSAAVEIDPAENEFLTSENIDVMVTTPEKLDLLIRRNHPSVEDVSLFVIDEAHTIENGMRGARLELLITMLRRERPEAKYMLLSPFLPGNMQAMKNWLGGGNSIQIDWKPSEKIVFGLKIAASKIKFDILPTPFTSGYSNNYKFTIDNKTGIKGSNKEDILRYAVTCLAQENRTQLILSKGKATANTTAIKIASWLTPTNTIPEEVCLIQKYIDEEIGCPTTYTQLLSQGVAVHHAGLSDETKILIEHLIRQGHIRYVCATTTIAEGVNFPVSSVYFDTYKRGRNGNISSNDFWNIAGRAGRTLVDDFGKIILPFNDRKNLETAHSLVGKSADELISVLTKLFVEREEIIRTIENDDNFVYTLNKNYNDSFGPLFQYFVHLLNVAENEYITEIEELFKDSLAYNLMDKESDRRSFIDLCKRIYLSIQAKYSDSLGALKFADKTGFSVPSVLKIMQQKAASASVSNLQSWNPDAMFNRNNSDNLAEKIKIIAALKETELGTESNNAPFNATIVAKMLIGWVKGDKVDQISFLHPHFAEKTDNTQRVSDFVKHMNDMRFKASWGLSALEGIVRGNNDDMKDSFIPSFVYYGVDDQRALALRMLGIPRSLSKSMSKVLPQDLTNLSFGRLRNTINNLSLRDWDELKPSQTNLSSEEWLRITKILMK